MECAPPSQPQYHQDEESGFPLELGKNTNENKTQKTQTQVKLLKKIEIFRIFML